MSAKGQSLKSISFAAGRRLLQLSSTFRGDRRFTVKKNKHQQIFCRALVAVTMVAVERGLRVQSKQIQVQCIEIIL